MKDGEPNKYTGRYDLGDNDGGLARHIYSFGAWYLTHDEYGHEKESPEESNDIVDFSKYLETFKEV